VFEIKEDVAPITAKNFVQLCEYHCYAGTMFKGVPVELARRRGLY
jgi:cyclophilin family peptidyl-prolyl cis-trans isomerase